MKSSEDGGQFSNSSCSFQVSSQIFYELQKGQALITFEKEEGMTDLKNMTVSPLQALGPSKIFHRCLAVTWQSVFAVSSCLHSGVWRQRQLVVSIYRDGIQALSILDVLVLLPMIYNEVITMIYNIIYNYVEYSQCYVCSDIKGFMLITHSKSNGSGNKI